MRLFIGMSAVLLTVSLVLNSAAQTEVSKRSDGTDQKKPAIKQAAVGAKSPASRSHTGLTVHEWGTFTSFSGSDGIELEFRPLVDEDLPPFVLDRFMQAGIPTFAKARIRTRLRMETPVTYFYTDTERDVNVKVGFPAGLLTEFYPPVVSMSPAFKPGEKLPIRNSSLDWGRVHLIPTDRLRANVDDPKLAKLLEDRMLNGLIPKAEGGNHYFHARETDSAIVQVHRKGKNGPFVRQPKGDYFEKFLFYRGVGNFDLPLELTATGNGKFELLNSGPDPIRSLFLVSVDGDQVRFSQFDKIANGKSRTLTQSTDQTTIKELGESVVQALIRENLYEKEARAMVKTWQSSWFGEQGTRLFYIVPPRVTDELLPLQIEPKPDETVRVLVGRMEIMTRETEERVRQLVRSSYQKWSKQYEIAVKNKQPAPKPAWPAEFKKLGRLAEPALVRVRSISKDRNVRLHAARLLKLPAPNWGAELLGASS